MWSTTAAAVRHAVLTSFVICCAGRSQSDASDDTPATEAVFLASYHAALCEAATRCCPGPVSTRNCGTDLPSFLAFDTNAARPELYRYQPKAAGRCLQKLRDPTVCDSGPLPIECAAVFEGQLGPHAACQANLECQPPAPAAWPVCSMSSDGVRQCLGASALGEPCDFSCDLVGICWPEGTARGRCYQSSGLDCPFDGSACEAVRAIGGPCQFPWDCASGACSLGACVDPGRIGSDCLDITSCMTGFYCTEHKCAPARHAPASCSGEFDNSCFGTCGGDGRCAINTTICAP